MTYGTVEGAATYHAERGSAAWADSAITPEARASALLRASIWVDATYRGKFPGYKTGRRAQVREWPRAEAYDVNGESIPDSEVPVEIVHATYEAALREVLTPGSLSPDYVAAERVVSERVGPISATYADATKLSDVRPVVSVVDDILSGLISTSRDVALFGTAERG